MGAPWSFGGFEPSGSFSRQVDVFDPSTSTWSSGPALVSARLNPTMLALRDGSVIVLGGLRVPLGKVPDPLATFERLDPGLAGWTVGKLPTPSLPWAACELRDGRVLLIAKFVGLQSWLSDTRLERWEELKGPTLESYYEPSLDLVVADDGRAYLFGVFEGAYPERPIEVFNPSTKAWSKGPVDVPEARFVATLGSDRILRRRANWRHDDSFYASVEFDVLDLKTWEAKVVFRSHHRLAARLTDQRVLLLGGRRVADASDQAPDPSTIVFDPRGGSIADGPPIPRPIADFVIAPLRDERVLVVGGWDSDAPGKPQPDTWTIASE